MAHSHAATRPFVMSTVTVMGMTTSDPVASPTNDDLVLRLASSAYLARFTDSSRVHTESDLRLYFTWCADRQLVPLAMARADVERYVRGCRKSATPSPQPCRGGWP